MCPRAVILLKAKEVIFIYIRYDILNSQKKAKPLRSNDDREQSDKKRKTEALALLFINK